MSELLHKKIIREEIVPRHAVQSTPGGAIACPHCGRHNLTLYGNLQNDYVEIWIEDPTAAEGFTAVSVPRSPEDVVSHEIESIACRDCQLLFQIQTEENFQLQQSNLELGRMLLEVSGRDPLGMGKPC